MRRRDLLATSSSIAVLGLAGCSSSDSDTTPTATDTATPSATATETPTETPTATETPTPASFEIVEISTPESVPLGEPFTFEITLENTGETSARWPGTIEYAYTRGPEPEPDWWREYQPEMFISGGETITEEFEFDSWGRPAVFYLRVDGERVEAIHSPLSKAPIIEAVNLVTEWEDFGDAVDNKTQTASAGSFIEIATRFWDWQENQTHHTRMQVKVYDTEDNSRVGLDSDTSDQITESSGWNRWEGSLSFDTSGWGAGEYRAEVLIRDEQNGEVSEAGTVTFELT